MDISEPITAAMPTVDGRVLQVLARTDLPLSGSRIASFIPGASREGVRLALHRLDDQGLLVSRSAPPAVLYTANRRHLLWPAIEILVFAADQTVLTLKGRIRDRVRNVLGPQETEHTAVALFGSVARGDSGPDSDVDVLLVVRDEVGAETLETLVTAVIDEVEAGTGNPCNVYAATRAGVDRLVARNDPMVASWSADAVSFNGPDIRRHLRGAPWDEPPR